MSIKRIIRPRYPFGKITILLKRPLKKKKKDKKGNESDLKGKVYKLVSVLRFLKSESNELSSNSGGKALHKLKDFKEKGIY